MAAVLVVLDFNLLTPTGAAEPPRNFFTNPSFELGREGWRADKAGKTECQFTLDEQDAADGRNSAVLTIGSVEDWGVQFGQSFPAGEKGRTYTFAVLAKSVKGPAEASLQIERSGKPYDRAAAGPKFKLTSQWQEFHVTFKVEKDFPQGWFAYLMCTQPNVQLRADLFRLYEGAFVSHTEATKQELAMVGAHLFDTGSRTSAPLPGEALSKRAGWTAVAEDDLTHKFKGEAVIMNDRLALVLRQGASGAEVYSLGSEAPALRATLGPASDGAIRLSSFKIVENNPGEGVAEAVFAAKDGPPLGLRYELKMGQPFVQTEGRNGTRALRVAAPCRFAVMPDFFADDIVVDAADLPVAQAELPSDNFLLHLSPDRQAMVMTVVKTSEEDLRIALTGEGDRRVIGSSELRYGKDGKIWVGVLAAPAIWHQQEIAKEDAGKIIRLEWQRPFPAQWRVDWRREEHLTDSWEMIVGRPDGSFTKNSAFGGSDTIPADRSRWTTVLGRFPYPAWFDCPGQAYLQPLKSRALRFEGPAIIYPINRVSGTALDTFTVLDIVRNTLGVGPCEYILDVEGQQSKYKGRATCSVRDTLNPIYAAHQQMQRQPEIEQVLQDLMLFVRHIRGRIETYVAFGHETLDYLAAQKQAHPDLAARLAELETLARGIDAKVAARREKIKTPDEAAAMVAEFKQTVLRYQGDDALAKCKQYTEGWVSIGGNQDELVGECRWAVKMIRQRAGLLMAIDPRLADVAKDIRRRSQIVLRNPAGHEGARH